MDNYEEFLRQNRLQLWGIDDVRRNEITKHHFQAADELVLWVKEHHQRTNTPIAEIAANAILTLITVTCVLLKRQIDAQAKPFQVEGGFTERLYKERNKARGY